MNLDKIDYITRIGMNNYAVFGDKRMVDTMSLHPLQIASYGIENMPVDDCARLGTPHHRPITIWKDGGVGYVGTYDSMFEAIKEAQTFDNPEAELEIEVDWYGVYDD